MQEPSITTAPRHDLRYRLAHSLPFYYGWIIVATAFVATFVGGGLQSFTFSIFLKPMTEELGWSRSALTLGLTIRTYASAFVAPLLGNIVDLRGPRLIMVVGSISGGIAALLLSRVQELWQFYLVYAVVGLLGQTGAGGLIISATVVKWFIRLRGRAVAFASMGGAASGAILAPIVAFVVVVAGWRTAWLAEGALFLALIPLTFFMVRQPGDVGLLPDGAKTKEQVQAAERRRRGHGAAHSWTLREAVRTRALWLLLAAEIIGGGPVGSVILHEYNFVTDEGFSPAVGAAVLSLHATSASAARLVWGFLVERIHVRYCIALTRVGCVLGIGVFLSALRLHVTPLLFVFAVVYGLNVGGTAVLGGVVTADYFGHESVGRIRGVMSPIQTIMLGGGPLAVSFVYDYFGSYWIAFIAMLAMFASGGVIILFAKPPVRHDLSPVAVPTSGDTPGASPTPSP